MISGSACEPIGAPGKHFKPPIMDRILFCFVCCFFFRAQRPKIDAESPPPPAIAKKKKRKKTEARERSRADWRALEDPPKSLQKRNTGADSIWKTWRRRAKYRSEVNRKSLRHLRFNASSPIGADMQIYANHLGTKWRHSVMALKRDATELELI